MGYFTKKEKVIAMVLVGFVGSLSLISFLTRRGSLAKDPEVEDLLMEIDDEQVEEDESLELEEDIEEEESGTIMVHICGQVNNPGIIEVEWDSRVIDVVNLAGGLKKTADSDRINLARKLVDEEKVYIPEIGEEELPEENSGSNETNKDNNTGGGRININLCSKEELMTLSGIGDVTAQKIIDYREENLFKSPEEIKNVSGIGDKKYEAIEEFITVK